LALKFQNQTNKISFIIDKHECSWNNGAKSCKIPIDYTVKRIKYGTWEKEVEVVLLKSTVNWAKHSP
jgi:hypothetical protein